MAPPLTKDRLHYVMIGARFDRPVTLGEARTEIHTTLKGEEFFCYGKNATAEKFHITTIKTVPTARGLIEAAERVIGAWTTGHLAEAVQDLQKAIERAKAE